VIAKIRLIKFQNTFFDMGFLELAKQKMDAAKDNLAKGRYSLAAKEGADAIELALKHPLRTFGISYENKKGRKLHGVDEFYTFENIQAVSKFLPFSPDHSHLEFSKILFKHRLWTKARNEINYGLERLPQNISTPDVLVEESLSKLIIADAESVLQFIGHFDSYYKSRLQEAETLLMIHGANIPGYEKVKQYIETLKLASTGAKTMTKTEIDKCLADIKEFQKQAEAEAQRQQDAENAVKGAAAIIGILLILGIFAAMTSKK